MPYGRAKHSNFVWKICNALKKKNPWCVCCVIWCDFKKVNIFTEWSRLIYKNHVMNTIVYMCYVGLLLNPDDLGCNSFLSIFLVPDKLGLKRKSKHFLSFHSFTHFCSTLKHLFKCERYSRYTAFYLMCLSPEKAKFSWVSPPTSRKKPTIDLFSCTVLLWSFLMRLDEY